jgi:hypothetical protein
MVWHEWSFDCVPVGSGESGLHHEEKKGDAGAVMTAETEKWMVPADLASTLCLIWEWDVIGVYLIGTHATAQGLSD